MIGMSFGEWVFITVVSCIAALVWHYGVRYQWLNGVDGFLAKWIFGWIGAWLGSPVLGYWSWNWGHIYVVPAFIGAFAASFMITATCRAVAKAWLLAAMRPAETQPVVEEPTVNKAA